MRCSVCGRPLLPGMNVVYAWDDPETDIQATVYCLGCWIEKMESPAGEQDQQGET